MWVTEKSRLAFPCQLGLAGRGGGMKGEQGEHS